MLAPREWFNSVDFPPQWTAKYTNLAANSGAGHADWQGLGANQNAALAPSKAETAKYVGGVTQGLVFQPPLEVLHTGKVLVPGVEIKIKFHFNGPVCFSMEWGWRVGCWRVTSGFVFICVNSV